MRIVSLILAALIGLSCVMPAIALDQAKFDLMVGKLEALMETRDIGVDKLVAALRKYETRQAEGPRLELAEALIAHFGESDRRIAWLKSQSATVKTVPTPTQLETVSGTGDAKTGHDETSACEAGTHATLTGTCAADVRACHTDGGKGVAKWNHETNEWGTCETVSCDAGSSLSADGRSCETRRLPGCNLDDRLVGGTFWAMCDSTGSHYLDYYFSAIDGDAACPAGYRLPTVDEWYAAYRETLDGRSESDEHRWQYAKRLADDLRLSARGQVWLPYEISVSANSFSLDRRESYEPSYGDIPQRERTDISPRATRVYGDYRYLASDGLFSLYASYDPENPLASVHIGKYPEWSDDELSRTFMAVRCVRDDDTE